jgi:hypothetical protein
MKRPDPIDIALLTSVAGTIIMSYSLGYLSGREVRDAVIVNAVPADLTFWVTVSAILLSLSVGIVLYEAHQRLSESKGVIRDA